MWNAVSLRGDFTASEVRVFATRSRDSAQTRRLLSIAAVYDGLDRGDAARIGGMDRQTLRDWVHRFNADGPEGLIDRWAGGPKSRLTAAQKEELSRIVDEGPDPDKDGVVRWRCLDLKGVIQKHFGVDYHERTVGKILKELGFSHVFAPGLARKIALYTSGQKKGRGPVSQKTSVTRMLICLEPFAPRVASVPAW